MIALQDNLYYAENQPHSYDRQTLYPDDVLKLIKDGNLTVRNTLLLHEWSSVVLPLTYSNEKFRTRHMNETPAWAFAADSKGELQLLAKGRLSKNGKPGPFVIGYVKEMHGKQVVLGEYAEFKTDKFGFVSRMRKKRGTSILVPIITKQSQHGYFESMDHEVLPLAVGPFSMKDLIYEENPGYALGVLMVQRILCED